MSRLLIVDDHLIVRHGLKQLVEGASDGVVTAETCSSQEAIKLLNGNIPDVILIGTTLSGTDQIELLKQLRASKPKLPVLILSVSDEEQYCRRLYRAGAVGILIKQSASSEIVDATTKVSRGGKYVSPALAERLTDFSADGDLSSTDSLSDREYQVMVSITSGKRMKQIADEMSLSIKTVSTYRSRMFQKLKLDNNAQLVRYAVEQGLIQDGVVARERLILTELNIRTAPVIATVKEIWRQRKAIIISVGIFFIIAYLALMYALRIVF